MELQQLKEHWDSFGKRDPLWAVLTDPSKRNGGWRAEEFFETGERDVEAMLAHARARGLDPARGATLDFGCGVGRLAQALCNRFGRCYGVDIAPSMIRLARKYNRHGGKCRYFLHDRADLSLFEDGSFDFVCSLITLQHMRPEYSKSYIREFLRVLSPGGLLVFQLPSELADVRGERAHNPAVAPLPESAFSAKITVDRPAPVVMNAGSSYTVRATVRNISGERWPTSRVPDGSFQINLGNHWLSAQRELVLNDDGRTGLPVDLGPGEAVALDLKVTAPAKAGDYFLELDLVQEAVAWFKERGSPTASVSVRVRERAARKVLTFCRAIAGRRGDAEVSYFGPIMEMHGVRKDEVLEVVGGCGATVSDIQEDGSAGPAWVSLRYFITK